jgi:hypothetical protein
VEEALAVEQAARDPELAGLEEDRLQSLDEARQLAQIEADEKAEYENKRTQAQQTDRSGPAAKQISWSAEIKPRFPASVTT